jgi:AcrR family transcriptional regulator
MASSRRGSLAKERLSRAVITEHALRVADAEGVQAITVRRITQELGVTPMALYWHFKDKDQLLDGVAERVFAGVRLPEKSPKRSWLPQLKDALQSVLAAVRPHPAVAELLPPRVLSSEPGLLVAEHVLALLRQGGFGNDRAAELGGYLLSSVVALVAAEPGRNLPAEAEAREDAVRVKKASLLALSPRRFPTIVDCADALADCASPETYYALGVDVLVKGVQRTVGAR